MTTAAAATVGDHRESADGLQGRREGEEEAATATAAEAEDSEFEGGARVHDFRLYNDDVDDEGAARRGRCLGGRDW